MKKTGLIAIVLGLLLAAWGFSPNRTEDEKVLLTILTKILEINHYHGQKVDDAFSKKVFDAYLDAIDYNKMYFLQSDIDALKKHEFSLDDEINNQNIVFYYEVQNIVKERLKETESYCSEMLEKPFDFTINEMFETNPDKREYPKNKAALKEYWRLYLKHMTLNTYLGKLSVQETALEKNKLDLDSVKTFEELEEESRKQVLKSMKSRYKRRAEIDDEDNFSYYVNSISSSFGPHTQYFPPQQKENFDLRMTGTLEGIGALLQQEDGYIKISSIVTGSASWRQGELKAGDLVLKVAQGKGEPVDIVDAPMKEVLKLIRGKKGTEVRLTVQKPDGDIKVIPIVRDVVIREETYAKSALFEQENNSKYGYINLPSFYSKFGKQDGRNSADDVKDELERLKKEGVNGVILDLRDNGGGSLQDAIKMAGLFFNKGPVVQVQGKSNRKDTKYDFNSNTTYDGHVVILVNVFSASASEILAGAMRDYDRAIIVGSSSTYGKGTVQTFIDLNRYVDPQLSLDQPFGSLKYTVQQFYRVNGSSTQFKGVKPHIELPDLSAGAMIGEKELENALPWDSIPAVQFDKWIHMDYMVSDLQKKNQERISNNELFKAITERADWLKSERENTMVSLNKDDAIKRQKERKLKNEAFNEMNFADESISVTSLQQFHNEPDSIVEKKRSEWEQQLSKDAYIREAMNILNDMTPTHDFQKVVKQVESR